MGWRFSRRVTLFPGVKINFSKSGISTTFGVPGASLNIGPKGAYLNTGIPGTGISHRSKISFENKPDYKPLDIPSEEPILFIPQNSGAIQSKDNNTITSKGFAGIKETLLAAYKEKEALETEIKVGETALKYAERKLNFITKIPFHRFLFKKTYYDRDKEYNECKESLLEAKRLYEECKVCIDVDIDSSLLSNYDLLKHSFEKLKSSQYCWDITSSVQIDRYRTRASADHSIDRRYTTFIFNSLDFVKTDYAAFHFKNVNGADLYLYPAS